MSSYEYIPDLLAVMPEVLSNSIISRVVLKNDTVNVTLFGFDTDQELTEHTASRPAMLHFLTGKAEVTLGGETQMATPGTWIFMPANLQHSIKPLEPTRMLLILIHGA